MRTIAAALATAVLLSAVPALAATDAVAPASRGPMPAPIQSLDARPNHEASARTLPATPRNDHRHYPQRGHRIIVIYVPYIPVGAAYYPYYYAPAEPAYGEQDPPVYAYREPSGFYYWCPGPAGYYPDQQDCPTGWRLVAP